MNRYITPEKTDKNGIKDLRKKLGMTKAEFVRFIHSSKATVERWEKSDEITGPITVLVEILKRHPEIVDEFIIPKRKAPLRLYYMHKDSICTIIDVYMPQQKIEIHNYTENPVFRAFGVKERPSFRDYNDFLKSRCFPEERDMQKLTLRELGLPFYDPFMIIEKTQGRMAEDDFWIKIERQGEND